MKTVSFVIPVYNPPEDRFRALLDSILSQTGVGVEVVAVDDGSTNGVPAILREYEAANPGKMKVLRQENKGQGPARNEGFLATTGDYVWFVDADDLVRPGAAAYLVESIERAGAEQVLFDAIECTDLDDRDFPAEWTGVVKETSPRIEIARRRIGLWCRLSRRSLLERVGVRFCDARTGEDGPEAYRWVLESRGLAEVDDPCYKYRMRRGSVSQKHTDTAFFAKGCQVIGIYDGLCKTYPEYAPWFNLWNYIRTRGLVTLAERCIKNPDSYTPEEQEAAKGLLRECKDRFAAFDVEDPLVLLYNFARGIGRRDFKYRAISAERKAKKLLEENNRLASNCAKLKREKEKWVRDGRAIRKSLSWRLTAPLRAVAGLFVGTRKRG
jgi:glycosyltransferase involved in cell wall biosynthesis